jgi:chromosome segregation ATPase
MNPLTPYMLAIKIGGVVLLLAALGGMYWDINYLNAQLDAAEAKLTLSENNNKLLNDEIETQNLSIIAANKKYDEVQKKLTEASGRNQEVKIQYKTIREKIMVAAPPTTCEGTRVEMINAAKEIASKWEK